MLENIENDDRTMGLDESEEAAVEHSSSIEELATQYGWNAEGEKSAEDFIKVAMDKFPDQSKKIKQLFRTVEELKVHMTKTEKVAYERAKKELEGQRREAIQQGDVELVDELDRMRSEMAPVMQEEVEEAEQHEAVVAFEAKNSEWLQGTSYEELKMQKWMQEHGSVLGAKRLPVEKHMELLDQHVRREFPDYFDDGEDNIKSPVASARDSAPVKMGKGKKFSFNDLSAEQKQIARDFESIGFMKTDDYIKSLVAHGELK